MKKYLFYLAFASSLTYILASCGSGNQSQETEVIEEEVIVESTEPLFSLTDDQGVYFENLTDGQEVSSPVHVVMGVRGMEVEPANEYKEGFGHHHIIIDGGSIEMGQIVPKDEKNIHYGDGSTETDLELAPGTYTLTMQFADGLHRSYGEQMSATITVTVTE